MLTAGPSRRTLTRGLTGGSGAGCLRNKARAVQRVARVHAGSDTGDAGKPGCSRLWSHADSAAGGHPPDQPSGISPASCAEDAEKSNAHGGGFREGFGLGSDESLDVEKSVETPRKPEIPRQFPEILAEDEFRPALSTKTPYAAVDPARSAPYSL